MPKIIYALILINSCFLVSCSAPAGFKERTVRVEIVYIASTMNFYVAQLTGEGVCTVYIHTPSEPVAGQERIEAWMIDQGKQACEKLANE
jgi:hypothetical protein